MDNFIEIFNQSNGNFNTLMLAASFLGGLLASISPCSLAMLPIIIGYVGGYSKESPVRTSLQMFAFIFGASLVFAIIGVICALTGKVFSAVAGGYFVLLIASLVMIMGLKLVGFLDFELPVIVKAIPQNKGNTLFLYPFMLGTIFALAGTPCSTPILAGIMGFATLTNNIALAVLMLFLFSLGQGLILVIAAVFTSGLKTMRNFSQTSEILLKVCGYLLIFASIFIFYKIFAPLIVN